MVSDRPKRNQSMSQDRLAGVRALQSQSLGDRNVRIAILDGPIDFGHECFHGIELVAIDTGISAAASSPGESAAHGTHIASIVLGRHDSLCRGIAPNCTGLIAPIFSDGPNGAVSPCTEAHLASVIRQSVDAGAQVINVSAGRFRRPEFASTAMSEAILYCEQKRRLLIAAAGNDGCAECLHIPGAITSPAVLVVGAMDDAGKPLASSNWGGPYQAQGIVALGREIPGAIVGGGHGVMSGTSVATAVVTGVAALLLSLQLKMGLSADPWAVRAALLQSAAGCNLQPIAECDRLLSGRLNSTGASLIIRRQGATQMNRESERTGFNSPPADEGDLTRPLGLLNGVDCSDAPNTESQIAPNGLGTPSVAAGTFGSTDLGGGRPLDFGDARDSLGMLPLGCGCGGSAGGGCSCKKGARQLVYVIGDQLDYDFGTRVREASMTDHFSSSVLDRGFQEHSLRIPINMLRYLLGWDGITGTGRTSEQELKVNGSLYDIKSLYWVLYQDACPIYVVQPSGMFAEAAYKQLLYFFIENSGIRLSDFGISPGCLADYFECHGGSSDPLPTGAEQPDTKTSQRPRRKKGEADMGDADPQHDSDDFFTAFLGEEPGKVSRIAIAGEVTGQVQLSTGEFVETISPDLRGMASWNTERLIEETTVATGDEQQARMFAARVLAALYAETRNKGKSPEERAKNWAATNFLLPLRNFVRNIAFRDLFAGLQFAAVSGVTAHPSDCRQSGMEYDVEVLFYSFENALRGQVALAGRVDVSDVVPVTLGRIRASTRR